MSDNTYGSNDLRCIRLTDIKGKHVKNDTLFLIFMTTGQISIIQIKFIFGGAMNFYQNWKDIFGKSGKNIYLILIFYSTEFILKIHNLTQQIF